MKCVVFRCSKKAEMYLYVPYQDETDDLLRDLPEGLIKLTGTLHKVMELELSADRKLARANVQEVIGALQEKGFYLQSPPNAVLRQDDSMLNNPSDTF